MMLRSYRRRLQDDLARWTANGLIGADQAAAIRREALAGGGGHRLVGVLAMLGALLLAAGVAALIAANWQLIPRLVRVAGVLALIAAGLAAWVHLQRGWTRAGAAGALPLPADAAATFATLAFGAGVALVGQMYHLPADWLAGTLTVALGALAAAVLTRSDGALLVAIIAVAAWAFGHLSEGLAHPLVLHAVLVVLLLGIAAGRERRVVHHGAVLSLALWLLLLPERDFDMMLPSELAYALGIGVSFAALSLAAEQHRGGRVPGAAMATAALPWGLLAVLLVSLLQLVRILDLNASRGGAATALAVTAGVIALASLGVLAGTARRQRATLLAAAGLLALLALPLLFWSGAGASIAGRVLVGALVLAGAVLMVLAGGMLGERRMTAAGVILFGAAVLVLLYRTVGSLVDQSLFFLVGGVILVTLAGVIGRLMKRREAEGAS